MSASEITSIGGTKKLSIHHVGEGIITRGALLDIAALYGVPWLEPGSAIMPNELVAAEERQNVTVRAGDALIVHAGNVAHALQDQDRKQGSPQAGLHAAYLPNLPYLCERDIATLGSDSIQDVRPSGFDTLDLIRPIHVVSLVALGLWLIDNMQLTELAEVCADEQRWEFLFTMLLWHFVGVTSSATNPVAVRWTDSRAAGTEAEGPGRGSVRPGRSAACQRVTMSLRTP
ncbi:cyclase family protein [Streptomyces prunicolor]|uniref:cyclase family protein n=1 Tax=Streptomyces prunicolor TaxID=67348 RepID=UPI00036B157B|nr:cyclase family protein [Streptomyces prunicolor]